MMVKSRVFRVFFRRAHALTQRVGTALLVFSMLFSSFGGIDIFFGIQTPLAPTSVGAAYTGKQLRTIEYNLGNGSENTVRASGVLSYAGTSWNTTKATAGKKNIVIEGSGIRVTQAYLDVSHQISASVNVTAHQVVFDADHSAGAGTDERVEELAANLAWVGSGLSGYLRGTHDVTAFFATTSDAQWNAGVGVVAGVATTFSAAANRTLTTVKLVITYEQDFSSSVHEEVKTVRLPLDSTNGTDTGSRQAVCVAGATCGFTYDTRNLPDWTLDADMLDVFVEFSMKSDSALITSITPQIVGGAAGSTYSSGETIADDTAVRVTWRPAIGAPNFTRNTLQTLNVVNSAGTAPLHVLGGEVVVTYRYSTGASEQSETLRYFVDQDTTSPGTATSTFRSIAPVIANSGRAVKHIWYRIHSSPYQAATLTIGGQVGTSTKKFNSYTLTGTNARSADTPMIIYDMSADAEKLFDNTVTIAGESRSSVANGPVGVEFFVTYTWDGDTASTVTKSVTYAAAMQGVNAVANGWNNRPVSIELPETVTKTYRSAYLSSQYRHFNGTTITVGTATLGVNASTTVITRIGDTEAHNTRYVVLIASSTLAASDTILWRTRTLEVNESRSVANYAHFSNEVVITYDAALGEDGATIPKKQLRTVEYVLGRSTDATLRTSGTQTWAGNTWGTIKAGAGTRGIVINGYNIRVVHAFVETSFYTTASANVTNLHVTLDAGGTSSSGTDVPVGEAVGVAIFSTTGLTGHIRGTHDVTALFDRQSDSAWAAGVPVVGSMQVTQSAGSRSLSTMKLVVTYESDYTLVPHNEVKTVRFPLDSTNGTDTGSRTTACPSGAICGFTYIANIPDAIADADILDVHFDMHAEVNSSAASDFDFQIVGMSTPSNTFPWGENINDDNTVDVLYQPPIGGGGFQRNTTQTLNVGNGTAPLNVLGGEIVVTYRFSTGAPVQTETVRYFNHQTTATPGTTRVNFSTITPTLSNGEVSVKNLWFKVHTTPYGSGNLTLYSRVGTSTEKSKAYAIATGNRAGNTPTIIHDMSADAGNFFAATTTIAGGAQYSVSTAASNIGAETYITFTWNGSLGGTTTRTVLFSAAQQGVTSVANTWTNRTLHIELPEDVTKTYRSAYVRANYLHSRAATTITLGTFTMDQGLLPTTITENGDTEAFNATYFDPLSSALFSGGENILWKDRVIDVGSTRSVANYAYSSNIAVVTYDAAQEYKIPTFSQGYYRIYADNNALTPSDAWPPGALSLGENTEVTAANDPPWNGVNLRVRMALQVATTTMLADSTAFKLQYAPRVTSCGAISSWSDLGAPGSGSVWRGYNAAPVDGTDLSIDPPNPGDLLLSVSSRAGVYGEANPTPLNPFAVAVGEYAEYDWNIQNNNAATNTPYCFRMTKSDGTPFFAYDFYPTIRTAGYTALSRNWRWYDDATSETPTIPLAGENIAPSDVSNGNTIKLRMTLNEVAGSGGVNQRFKVQYSEWADFSLGVTDLIATTSCTVNSIWCYGDGVDTDDTSLSTLLLTDSMALGRHNESGTLPSTMAPLANTATEFEFTLKHAGARANATYFFRLWDVVNDRPVALAGGASYPSLSTEGALITATISGLATSTATEGATTDVGTTATGIPFGNIPIGTAGVIAGQRLTISTNATEGYQVFLKANGPMISSFGTTIPNISSENTSPLGWALACNALSTGCWGYHSGDDTLYGGSTRFLVDDTYAQLSTTTLDEIVYNSGPVDLESTDVLFRVEAHESQTAGQYTTQLQYIVVPIF